MSDSTPETVTIKTKGGTIVHVTEDVAERMIAGGRATKPSAPKSRASAD